jgi:GntR family transcriptional regulator/MocR family aminotransferase
MLIRLGPERPLYQAVYLAVRRAILSGQLAANARLPGTRALARQLGVSRIVVLGAFDRLASEGYIVASSGSGSRVAAVSLGAASSHAEVQPIRGRVSAYARRVRRIAPHAAPVQTVRADIQAVDFRYATFIPDAAAIREWRHAIARAAASTRFEYPNPAGVPALRRTLCEYLRRHRGLDAEPDDVIIVSGSQQALDLIARTLLEPRAAVGMEDPHYQGSRQAFLAAGARVVPCTVDGDGLDIERFQRALHNVHAVYVTPSHQFPTGAVMSIERRLKLLEWAAERRVWLIEDDYDTEFQYGSNAVPALQGLDRHRCVLYIGTVVRTLSPGLRLGYMVVPPALREAVHGAKWLADRGTSPLEQSALADFIESGAYDRTQRRMARVVAQKRNAFFHALERYVGAERAAWSGSGAHAFLRLHGIPASHVDALIDRAVQNGVRVYSGTPYFMRSPRTATLICGFATLNPEEIELGVRRLAAVL